MADFLGRWEMPSASEKKKENKVKLRQRINKDIDQCMRRFKIKNPLIKKGKWTKDEDILLMNLFENHGKNRGAAAELRIA